MRIETGNRGEVRVLTVLDHVSASDVDALTAELAKLKEPAGTRAVIDMTGLKNLPTAVLGRLIETVRALESTGGRLVLAGPNSNVRVALERLGLAPMMATTESLDAAVELLESGEAPG